jgi:hypothetical protein
MVTESDPVAAYPELLPMSLAPVSGATEADGRMHEYRPVA